MTRIDEVAAIMYDQMTSMGVQPTVNDIARALDADGHLMPDQPEPYMSKFDSSATFTRDEDSEDGAYIDVNVATGTYRHGRITIDLDPSRGSENGFTLVRAYASPQWCREAAALLLAAANYAEEHANDQ